MIGRGAVAVAVLVLLIAPSFAEEWRTYSDPQLRYRLDLPTTSFRREAAEASGHLMLTEIAGTAQIDVYTGANTKHLSPDEFAAELSRAGEIRDITYRASGQTWFVISGHYASGNPSLIYYAKYVFSDGLTTVAGFEVSYTVDEKLKMDPIVTHLEKSFRAASSPTPQ